MPTITPWNLRPDPQAAHRPLPPRQHKLIHAVLRYRALFEADALRLARADDVTQLLATDLLHRYPSPWGPVLVPGPAGLLRAGRAARNRPSPTAAVDHAYLTRAAVHLRRERGWKAVGVRRRNLLIMRDADGTEHYLCARARGHSSRSLWRLIGLYRLELSIGGGTLVIVTPDRRRARCVHLANQWCTEIVLLRLETVLPTVEPAPRYTGRRRRIRPTTPPAAT